MSQPLASFSVILMAQTATVRSVGDITIPIRYQAQAIAGWGTANTDFNEATPMTPGIADNPYYRLAVLYDASGNPLPSFTTLPWANGQNEGMVSFKVLAPMTPGGAYTDVALRAVDPHQRTSGSGSVCRVFIEAPAAAPVIRYEVKINDQSRGYVFEVPSTDRVTLHQGGQMVWATSYVNPITGDRTGNW